jgi:hypothetical protein
MISVILLMDMAGRRDTMGADRRGPRRADPASRVAQPRASMSISPCLPGRWGLTGPHPNPLSDLRLFKPCGTAVSLHRYAGRWVVLRLTEQPPDPSWAPGDLPSADFVPLNVVAGPISATRASVPIVFDPMHGLSTRFPAIDCPATFVIDPEGRLIAILDDQGWPEFLADLLHHTGRTPAHGAIDQQDIRR